MPDWNLFARNLIYGAIHRPAQVARWVGERFTNEAAPIGAAIIDAANQVDSEAYLALDPGLEPTGEVSTNAPPPPPTAATWIKPSGTIYPFLSCPVGYTLIRVSPILEVPGYSCLLNGTHQPLPPPPLSDWAF